MENFGVSGFNNVKQSKKKNAKCFPKIAKLSKARN
jgi:hypothetical protein